MSGHKIVRNYVVDVMGPFLLEAHDIPVNALYGFQKSKIYKERFSNPHCYNCDSEKGQEIIHQEDEKNFLDIYPEGE